MLSEKIFYYTNRIKAISADIEKENSKIIEYQTLLIQEESKYNEKSFFHKLFNKNNSIKTINKIVNEHLAKLKSLEDELKKTVSEFLEEGTNSIIQDNEKNCPYNSNNDLNVLINTFISYFEKNAAFFKAYQTLHQKMLTGDYYIDDYKKLFHFIKSFINDVKNQIQYLYESYEDVINFNEISIIDNNLDKYNLTLNSITKYNEIKKTYHNFSGFYNDIVLFYNILQNLEKKEKDIRENIKKNKSSKKKEAEIIFINKVFNEHSIDLTRF
jgi:hypothetical protein